MLCSCGFTCGTQTVFARHLRRFEGCAEGGVTEQHRLVEPPSAQPSRCGEEAAATKEPGWSLLHSRPHIQSGSVSMDDSELPTTQYDECSYSEEHVSQESPPSVSPRQQETTVQEPTAFPIQSFSLDSSLVLPPQNPSIQSEGCAVEERKKVWRSLPFEQEGLTACIGLAELDDCLWTEAAKSPRSACDVQSPESTETPVALSAGSSRQAGVPPPSTFASAVQMASDISSMRMFQLRSMAMSIVGLDPDDASTPRMRHTSISAATDVILWVDPWLSVKVFGLGMYFLLCIQHFVQGALVSPSCVLASTALFYLAANVICRQWSGPNVDWGRDHDLRAQEFTTDLLLKVSMAVIPLIGAVAGLIVRTLSGRHLATTIWTSLALSLVLLIGQLQLVGQVTLAMVCWTGVFTLPWMYCKCQHALDALAEELVQLGTLYFGIFPRTVHCIGLSSGIISSCLIEASGLTKIVSGAAIYAGFLFWSYLRLHSQPAAVITPDG